MPPSHVHSEHDFHSKSFWAGAVCQVRSALRVSYEAWEQTDLLSAPANTQLCWILRSKSSGSRKRLRHAITVQVCVETVFSAKQCRGCKLIVHKVCIPNAPATCKGGQDYRMSRAERC